MPVLANSTTPLKLESAGALPNWRVSGLRLKRAFGDPDACQLQDRSALERDLDVARNPVRRRVGTLGGGKRDAVLFVEEGGRALARERELRALELEDGVGRPVQIFLRRRGCAPSGLGECGIPAECQGSEQTDENKNRVNVSHVRSPLGPAAAK